MLDSGVSCERTYVAVGSPFSGYCDAFPQIARTNRPRKQRQTAATVWYIPLCPWVVGVNVCVCVCVCVCVYVSE